MTEKCYSYFFLAAILSLFLHFSLPFLLELMPNKNPVAENFTTPVKIRLINAPKVQPIAALVQHNPDNPRKTAPGKTEVRKDTYAVKKKGAPLSYNSLFPTAAWPSGRIVAGSTDSGPPATVVTQKIAGQLSGQLDIPLVFRENSAQGQAVAKFRLKSENEWYFEYIDGEPVLRAVLYQAFTKQTNLDTIAELARELNKKEIIFVIQQTTKPALDGWKQFNDGITYSNNRIIFSRTIYTGSDGSSGIALPDKEAERAVMRDKVALRRLMDSPAYFSPIRNRKIETK